jgi:hypothetical protein
VDTPIRPPTESVEPPVDPLAATIEPPVDLITPVVEPPVDAIAALVEAPREPLAPGRLGALRAAVQNLVDAVAATVQTPVDPVAPLVESMLEPVTAPIEALFGVRGGRLRNRHECQAQSRGQREKGRSSGHDRVSSPRFVRSALHEPETHYRTHGCAPSGSDVRSSPPGELNRISQSDI